MQRLRVLSQIAAGLVFTTALGAAPGTCALESRQRIPGQTQETKPPIKTRKFQVGKASWYGRFFQRKQTAGGEPYDMYQFTAAHRTLPLGSWVKVTDLKNNRSVIVRINDRGPVQKDRIIDLSYSAAKMLDMDKSGVHPVRLDLIETSPQPVSSGSFPAWQKRVTVGGNMQWDSNPSGPLDGLVRITPDSVIGG